MKDRVLNFRVESEERTRLDKFLTATGAEYSRSRWQGLIEGGLVEVDGRRAAKSGQMLEPGQHITVRVPIPEAPALVAESISLEVVFENVDLMIINKPAGIVVHPAPGHGSGTLANAVLGHDPRIEGIGGEIRPGIVHRLDKETSGLIAVAKNERAYRSLQDQFRLRTVEKRYLALVEGKPPSTSGRVEASIGRNPRDRKKMAVLTRGVRRAATSEYRTLETFPGYTLLEVKPLTGRTHQIRIHCAFLGCPILGDSVYGKKRNTFGLSRHFLHASFLRLTVPGEKVPRAFQAGLPPELEDVLTVLRERP